MNDISREVVQVASDENGLLRPKTLDEAYRFANATFKSKLLPPRFDSPEKIMIGMQFVMELGLNPLTGLRQMAIVNGTPAIFGDLPLALCYGKGCVEYINEYYFDISGNVISSENKNLNKEVFGAACVVKRKGDQFSGEGFFTKEDAKKAGLYKNDTWAKYERIMLRYRARAQALKAKFPDALNGIAIAEYDFNLHQEEIDKNVYINQKPKLDKLKDILASTPQIEEAKEKTQDEIDAEVDMLMEKENLK